MVLKKRGMQQYCLFLLMLFYISFSYRFAVTVTNRTTFFLLECCFQNPTPILLNHCHRLNEFQRQLGARFEILQQMNHFQRERELQPLFQKHIQYKLTHRRPEVRASFSLFQTQSKERKLGEKGWCNEQDTNKQNILETLVCICTDTRIKH